MATTSLAHQAHRQRTVCVENVLLEEISELTGIEYRALCRAFVSEEKNLVLDVVKLAVAENLDKTPEDWQRHVLAWAKENGTGQFRPGYWEGYELSWEYNDYLRSIGRLA